MRALYWILLVVASVVIWLHIRFTYKVPSSVVILQSSLGDFDPNMLLEKQPIVIQDRVESMQPIWDGWFRYNRRNVFGITPDMEWIRNRHKFMLLHAQEDSEVMLCYPLCKAEKGVPDTSEEVITIKLYKGMSLIVPYRWYIATNSPTYACGVHDVFTYLLPS
jgi:hypothetical protein